MKGIMLKLFVIVVLLANTAFAQKYSVSNEILEKAKENSVRNLDSEVNGVVESTLFVIMMMKKHYPESNYNSLFEEVNRVSVEGTTPEIRLKAQLCGMYLAFPKLFAEVSFEDKANPGKYFAEISDKLKNNLLTVR